MDMSITKTSSALTIHWSEGDAGGGPVTGYVIETRASGEPSEREKKECFVFAKWEVQSCLTLNLSVQLLCHSLRPAALLSHKQFSNEGHQRCDTESERLRG